MGEGLEQVWRKISSSRAEDLGDSSSLYDGSDDCNDSDLTDDDSSSSRNSSSNLFSSALHLDSNQPNHQLSSKKSLSKYYQGKSQSFTSLSHVISVEDLAKKETPYTRRLTSCKSYAGGLDESHNSYYASGPYKKTMPNNTSRVGSCASLIARSNSSSGSFFCNNKPPTIPMQKNL